MRILKLKLTYGLAFQQTEYIREGPLSAPRHCPHSEEIYTYRFPARCQREPGAYEFHSVSCYPIHFYPNVKSVSQQAPTNLFFFATLHSTDDTLQALNLGFYTGIAESKARQRNYSQGPRPARSVPVVYITVDASEWRPFNALVEVHIILLEPDLHSPDEKTM